MKTPLEEFRFRNGLTKKDIGDYLGVSAAFAGAVCNGKSLLPAKHLVKILNNDKGWDISMFKEKEQPEQLDALAVMSKQLEAKDQQIKELMSLLAQSMVEKYELMSKIANENS